MNLAASVSLERGSRRRSLAMAGTILGFLLLTGLAVFVTQRWRQMVALDRHGERLAAERRVLRQARPELSPAQAAALGRRMHELDARAVAAAGPWRPPSSSRDDDLFLHLASFVNDARARLLAAGIQLEAGERFGFAECLERPPPEAGWPRLRAELALASTVLDALEVGAPSVLCQFQRGGARGTSEGSAAPRDAHAMRKQGSELVQVEVKFLGDTATLRRFVNALQSAEPRVWVETLAAETASSGTARRDTMKFTVRVASPGAVADRAEVRP